MKLFPIFLFDFSQSAFSSGRVVAIASLTLVGLCGFGKSVELSANENLPVADIRPATCPIRSQKNIVFQEIDGKQVQADLYRPDSDVELPIVVMIHGGAWMTGDKWNVVSHATEMAEAGFLVMAINYRLAPEFPWPAHQVDCQAALSWMAKHAQEWHGNLDRLGVWGYSAGGHLALMIALEQMPGLPEIKACVAGGPPCDLDFIPLKSRLFSSFLGGSREECPDRYRSASPIHLLTADDPPLFFFHGDQDIVVPIENSKKMHEKVVEIGIVNEYLEVPNLGHLMTFIDRKARIGAIAFLKKHLAPSLP